MFQKKNAAPDNQKSIDDHNETFGFTRGQFDELVEMGASLEKIKEFGAARQLENARTAAADAAVDKVLDASLTPEMISRDFRALWERIKSKT